MKLSQAKLLYYRVTLLSLNVDGAMEMPEEILEFVLNSRSLRNSVDFMEWASRCQITLEPDMSAEEVNAAKDQSNKSAVVGLVAAMGGGAPPPTPEGQKPHVPTVSITDMPPQKESEISRLRAQGTKDPHEK